jgi:hypothetical protein
MDDFKRSGQEGVSEPLLGEYIKCLCECGVSSSTKDDLTRLCRSGTQAYDQYRSLRLGAGAAHAGSGGGQWTRGSDPQVYALAAHGLR